MDGLWRQVAEANKQITKVQTLSDSTSSRNSHSAAHKHKVEKGAEGLPGPGDGELGFNGDNGSIWEGEKQKCWGTEAQQGEYAQHTDLSAKNAHNGRLYSIVYLPQ